MKTCPIHAGFEVWPSAEKPGWYYCKLCNKLHDGTLPEAVREKVKYLGQEATRIYTVPEGTIVLLKKAADTIERLEAAAQQERTRLDRLREVFDALLIAEVHRYGGIPSLAQEDLALREVIAELLASHPPPTPEEP